jgi:F-type H+-transporting ATPase subunit epsilon
MLRVRIVSPARVVYEGEAASVVAPAWDGKLGILPRHAPMIALLGAGELVVDLPGGGSRTFHVAGGVLQVVDDQVTVLSEYAGEDPPDTPHPVVSPEEVREHAFQASRGNPLV